jgi:hypothetical protein
MQSVKCRSIRLPCSGAQPRPLLLPDSGRWIPWSFYLKTPYTFPHDDYFIPSVTDIATPDIVYLSYKRDGVISGIHEKPEGSRTQVPLGPLAKTRSVKLLVLCHSISLSRIPYIQVRKERLTPIQNPLTQTVHPQQRSHSDTSNRISCPAGRGS